MKHIMLDIETLDTTSSAVVVSIGAVRFDPVTGHVAPKASAFRARLDLDDQIKRGRTVNGDTIAWWMQQSADARAVFALEGKPDNLNLLRRFAAWVNTTDPKAIWGNGANFDNVIVRHLLESYGVATPWKFWQDECYRTIRNRVPGARELPIERVGVYHNAVDDALTQAHHLHKIFMHAGWALPNNKDGDGVNTRGSRQGSDREVAQE